MQKIKTSLKGRKCKFLHCRHILSIYNHEEYCYVHLGEATQRHKQKVSKS